MTGEDAAGAAEAPGGGEVAAGAGEREAAPPLREVPGRDRQPGRAGAPLPEGD